MLTQLSPDLIGVSVPGDSSDFYILKVNGKKLVNYEIPECNFGFEPIPEGNWQILGYCTKDEVSFDVEPYVGKVEDEDALYVRNQYFGDYRYINYDKLPVDWFDSFINPQSSFRSLLSSKGIYFVNPYGEKEPNYEDYLSATSIDMLGLKFQQGKCQTAQFKVVEKVIILKKV